MNQQRMARGFLATIAAIVGFGLFGAVMVVVLHFVIKFW